MLLNLILGEKYGLIITSRIILSFILNGPGRAIQNGSLRPGIVECDHFMEVTA